MSLQISPELPIVETCALSGLNRETFAFCLVFFGAFCRREMLGIDRGWRRLKVKWLEVMEVSARLWWRGNRFRTALSFVFCILIVTGSFLPRTCLDWWHLNWI